jgi:hypothetical protein
MSTVNLSAIAGALATLFEDDIPSQFNRAVVLSQVLPFKPGESQNLAWDVRATDGAAGSSVLADGTDVSTYNTDTKTKAVLQWGTYSEAFGVTGKALAAAAITGNPLALKNLFAEEIETAVTRLTSNINKDFYTGSGATDTIQGLTSTNGGLKATGTYAGIDRSVTTLWAGNELLNGGVNRPNSIKLMRDTRRTIYVASGEYPDVIVTDPVQHEALALLLDPQRRYIQDVMLRGQKIVLDGGFRALEFDGIPVIADKDAPANKMLFLNTRHVRTRQMPDAMAMAQIPAGMGQGGIVRLHGSPEEQIGGGQTALSARINPLAVTGDAYKFQLVLYPQLQVRRPNACAILGDLQ